jgi:imidazolonepropionase-like amidohydrolase
MTSDTNEMSDTPLTPFVRSLDGINPDDMALEIINSGGVTTSLVLPGSGNIMGGEAFIIKHRKVDRVSRLLFDHHDPSRKRWRYMKMACGENPINVYGRGKGKSNQVM